MNVLPAALLALAVPAFAQSTVVVVTKDGQRHSFNLAEVARIEFGNAVPGPAPAPPPPPRGKWLDAFLGGKLLPFEARQGTKAWPGGIKVTQYNRVTGALSGELTWSSLNSVHRIQGELSGSRLTFTEVSAIHPGGAHLNVAYTLTVTAGGADGTWTDPADRSTGTAVILPQ